MNSSMRSGPTAQHVYVHVKLWPIVQATVVGSSLTTLAAAAGGAGIPHCVLQLSHWISKYIIPWMRWHLHLCVRHWGRRRAALLRSSVAFEALASNTRATWHVWIPFFAAKGHVSTGKHNPCVMATCILTLTRYILTRACGKNGAVLLMMSACFWQWCPCTPAS